MTAERDSAIISLQTRTQVFRPAWTVLRAVSPMLESGLQGADWAENQHLRAILSLFYSKSIPQARMSVPFTSSHAKGHTVALLRLRAPCVPGRAEDEAPGSSPRATDLQCRGVQDWHSGRVGPRAAASTW